MFSITGLLFVVLLSHNDILYRLDKYIVFI